MDKDEGGFGDVTDLAGAERDPLQGAPPLGHQGEAAFALVAQQRVSGPRIDVQFPAAGRRVEPGDLGFGCGEQPGEIMSGATAVDTWTPTSATTSEHRWTFWICDPTCALNRKVKATARLKLSDVQDGYYTETTFTFKDLPASMKAAGYTNPWTVSDY